MKKLLPLTLTILTSTYVSTVNADDNWYLGALYNTQKISTPGRDFNTAGIVVGYQYNPYLSLETRLAAGTSGYASFYGTPEAPYGHYSEDINSQTSLLVRASYPIVESFSLYGLAGYTNTKMEVKGLGSINDADGNITGSFPFKLSYSERGFSYGVGLSYQINMRFSVFLDYQVLPNFEPDSNISNHWKGTTFGVNYSF